MTGLKERLLQNRSLMAVAGSLLCTILAVGPVFFIRRSFNHFYDHWQELAFYAVCILAGALSLMWGFGLYKGIKEDTRQRSLIWISTVFSFLYLSCAVLCERLSVGMLNNEVWRDTGFAIFMVGCVLRLWCIAKLGKLHSGYVAIQAEHKLVETGPYKRLRHPSYLGALLAAVGVPMIFGAWFPLLAVPGIFVMLKWRIEDEEKLLLEHFGEEYKAYAANRWRLVPYIY